MATLRVAKEAKGLNSWFVPLTVQKMTDLALTPYVDGAIKKRKSA
jgi:hypothetical protein